MGIGKSKILDIVLWALAGIVLLATPGYHQLAQPMEERVLQPGGPTLARPLAPSLTLAGKKQEILVRGYVAAEVRHFSFR